MLAAEPPWNSLHSIWYPSPLPALHLSLLKELVILEPNSSKSKAQCNLWKWKELSVSHKFFWSVEIEQPLLVAKLTRAEINGFRAGRCVWRPPSLHEILFILIWCPFPLPACSSLVLFERSSHAWTKPELICKQANEVRAMWDAQHKTVLWKQVWVLECVLREIIRFVLENYSLFGTGEFRERLHAQSAQVNSCSEMPEILDLLDFALGLRQHMQKTAGGWRHRIASPRRAIKPQHSETGIILWHVVM